VVAAGSVKALEIPATDLDGRNRTVCGTIDMGVYEVHPSNPAGLRSSLNPSVVGNAVTFTGVVPGNCHLPTGVLTFFDGPTPLGSSGLNPGGAASLTTSALTVGSHNITARYGGDANFDPSVSATLVQVVLATAGSASAATTTALTASPNPAGLGEAVNLQATVAAAASVAGGTVDFLDGGIAIGKATLNAAGVAVFSTTGLGLGQHVLTAFYEGAGSLDGSVSAPVTETIIQMSYTLALNPATVTMTANGSGSTNVQLTSVGGFAGPLTLSIGNLPKNVQSQFTPGVVTLTAGGSGTAVLLLSISKPVAAMHGFGRLRDGAGGVLAAMLLLVPLGWRRRTNLPQALLLVLAVTVLAAASGCTNLYFPIQQVTPGSYTVPVTATDTQGNAKSADLTLVVTP
jgi:hypothetical protein